MDEQLSKANLERWGELDKEERHDMEVIRNSRYLQLRKNNPNE